MSVPRCSASKALAREIATVSGCIFAMFRAAYAGTNEESKSVLDAVERPKAASTAAGVEESVAK